jgi:uncharacterized protein (DUF2147 family)
MTHRYPRVKALIALAAVASCALAGAARAEPGERGRWLTESGNLEVEIASCGPALCGKVVRVLANRSMSDPTRTIQPAEGASPMGLTILSELTPIGVDEWQGRIYNRENGKTYDCRVKKVAPDRLSLRTYVLLPLFGRTQVWTRVATASQG